MDHHKKTALDPLGIFLIMALALIVMPVAPCLGDETTDELYKDVPRLEPVRVFEIAQPSGEHLDAADLPFIGDRFYLEAPYSAINIWTLLVYYWPQWMPVAGCTFRSLSMARG